MFKTGYDLWFEGPTLFVGLWLSVMIIWLIKFVLGRLFYFLYNRKLIQQYPERDWEVTSLVTYAGDLVEYFEKGMRTLRSQTGVKNHKIYLMMDAMDDVTPNDEACLKVAEQYADRIYLTNHKKKRFNLDYLTDAAEKNGDLHEIMHLVDSDTIFPDERVLHTLTQPYADSEIAGTTTAQRAYITETPSEIVGDMLEDNRNSNGQPACSLFKEVPCQAGRSITFLRDAIRPYMKPLASEYWGVWMPRLHKSFPFILKKEYVECKAGDDRFLTDAVHRAGYKNVFVPDAEVKTLLGETFRKTFRQWMRWGTTSQGYVLRHFVWLAKNKPASFANHLADMYVAHASVIMFWGLIFSLIFGDKELYLPLSILFLGTIVLLIAWFVLRNLDHYRRHPRHLLYIFHHLVAITFGSHIRVFTIWTPWLISFWGTRGGIDDAAQELWVREHHFKR